MPDLLAEYNLDTSRAPEPGVSPQQVAQPYSELAHALAKTGEAATDIAEMTATRAGYQAVTTDEHGNIQIQKAPIIGPASKNYEEAVKMAALAQGEGVAKDADITLRNQFSNDPQGYLQAANEYKNGVMKRYADAGVPEVGISLGRAIDATTTYNFRALSNQKRELDLKEAGNEIDAGISRNMNYLTARAREGAFTDPKNLPPDVQTAYDAVRTLINQKVTNPIFGNQYPQAKADADFDHLDSQLRANSVMFHVDSVYHDTSLNADGTPRGGYGPAVEAARSILSDRTLQLDEQERQHYSNLAMSEVRAEEGIRHQNIQEVRAALTNIKADAALGVRIDPVRGEQLRAAAKAANWPGGIAAIDTALAHLDLHDDHGQLPLRQQLDDINTIKGVVATGDAYNFLRGRGYSDIEASGIVGNLVFESGMRPAVPGDAGTSAGLAQWHAERLNALKSYAASQGKPWQDPQTQLEFLDRELRSTEGVTRGLLRTAKTPEEAASIFAAAYERPRGADYSGRQTLARSIFEGKPADGSRVGPGPSSWLIANREGTLDTAATQQFKAVKSDWDNGKGMVRKGDLLDVIDAARETHNIDLSVKAQRLADQMDYVERAKATPLDQQYGLETELRRRMDAGTADNGSEEVLKQLEAKTKAISEGLASNPIATTVANNSDRWKTPEPIAWDNAASIDAGLKRRLEISQAGANQWQTGPLPILDRPEVSQMLGALKGGNAAGVLTAIGQEPQAIRQALLQEKELRESITGMARSGDPAKMNVAYSTMDTLQKQNPLQFEKQFPDGLKDLRAWQGNLAFYPPDVAAKRMLQANDPDQTVGREMIDKAANKALENLSPTKVVSKFSTGFGPFGTSAQAPVSDQAGVAAGALKADYDKNFRDGFAATADANAADNFAMEKLNLKYGVSPTSGNRVMAYPPERYYPAVGGSHDWMSKQLDDEMARHLGVSKELDLTKGFAAGVEPTALYATGETPAERQYGAARALVADPATEADIAAGRPPSYQVVLRDPNGRWSIMTGANGTAQRFRFDPAAPFAERAAAAEAARPTVQALQEQTPALGGQP